MKKYFKKSLSLFMAALMLMSCWVFFAPEAEAVNAGKSYKVEITATITDSDDEIDNWQPKVNYNKTLNGGSGTSTANGDSRNGSGESNQTWTITCEGFPTTISWSWTHGRKTT